MPPLWGAGGFRRIATFGQAASSFGCGDCLGSELRLSEAQGVLTAHLRQQARSAGYPELERMSRSKLHKILTQGELRPHKVRYYVERRDPEFESKMAAVLHVYKEVEILNEGLLRGEIREPGMVTVSYDEKPGIQALAQKTPDRPPMPGQHASPTRDYEYKRLGTVSLLAGLDMHRGTVT